MAYNYVVTAQQSTAIDISVVCNFLAPDQLNLICAKGTVLEVSEMTEEGLQKVVDLSVRGKIENLSVFRAPHAATDSLLLVFADYQFCTLSWNAEANNVTTGCQTELYEEVGKPVDSGVVSFVDAQCRIICMHLYDGMLKVIPLDKSGSPQVAFELRLPDLHITDMCVLHGPDEQLPCLVYIFESQTNQRALRSYFISVKDKELRDGPIPLTQLDYSANVVRAVPQPLGGVLVWGEEQLSYVPSGKGSTKSSAGGSNAGVNDATAVNNNSNSNNNNDNANNTSNDNSGGSARKRNKRQAGELCSQRFAASMLVKATAKIDGDGSRWLFADINGNLFVTVLLHQEGVVTQLKIEKLGVVSGTKTLSYLDNGVVFVGSAYGDSQLIRLLTEADADTGQYLEVLDSYANIGPIVDFCVVDMEGQGKGQVVTCSGAWKDGSIRIIRNGIGINVEAELELPAVKGVFSMRESTEAPHHKILALTFISNTIFLAMEDEELGEIEIPSMRDDVQTLYCGSVVGDQLIQVTKTGVVLVGGAAGFPKRDAWQPAEGQLVSVCSCNTSQILLAVGGKTLVYLEVQNQSLKEVHRVELEHEIACCNVTPIRGRRATFCSVGLWTELSVRVFELPNLEQRMVEKLGGEVIPRSVLMFAFEENDVRLLVGLGDGNLLNYTFNQDEFSISQRKRITLGTKPILLSTFVDEKGEHNVFASSDRPTVIYSKNKKVLYSNVNLSGVLAMAPFNTELFPHCLAFVGTDVLRIGGMDEIQKLHITSIPMGEMVRRIVHLPETHVFAVVTTAYGSLGEVKPSYVRILDDQTMETLHSMQLDELENAASLVSMHFASDGAKEGGKERIVVGTAYLDFEAAEPERGRILVYSVVENKLVLETEVATSGAVYALCSFKGQLLAGVNARVELYSYSGRGVAGESGGAQTADKGKSEAGSTSALQLRCHFAGHVMVLFLKAHGDFILVGDIMRSVSLLSFNEGDTPSLELTARDYQPNWMTEVDALDEDHFIGAENSGNLFTLKRNAEATSETERRRLLMCGAYHVGDLINRFRRGSLVMPDPNKPAQERKQPLLYATVGGAIGVIGSLSEEDYVYFSALQKAMVDSILPVGALEHHNWRAFKAEQRRIPSSNFIDGDLIESYLDLSRSDMEKVAEKVDQSVEEVTRRIEQQARMLH